VLKVLRRATSERVIDCRSSDCYVYVVESWIERAKQSQMYEVNRKRLSDRTPNR
jgi:hypothetical protein